MTAPADSRPQAPAWDVDPRAVLTALASAVYQWDVASDQISWSDNAAAVLGVPDMKRLTSGAAWRRLLSSRSPAGRDEAILAGGGYDDGSGAPYDTRYEVMLPRGGVTIEDNGRWFAGWDGKPAIAHGMIRVLSAAPMAQHDLAAGARADLLRRIDQQMATTRASGKPFALLTGCVRDYRAIDAQHGSEIADALVRATLTRLQRVVRQTDYLIRYASNHFALLLGRCPRDEIDAAAARLSRLACAEPIETESGRFTIATSWGAVANLDGAADARMVLRRCEDAMQQALARSALVEEYRPDRQRESRRLTEQAAMEEGMRALNERRILIARQPIVSAQTRAVKFEEALARVRRDDGEIASAGTIVPMFERHGRIELLDHRVLELAIDTLVAEPQTVLSINASADSLLREDWLSTLSSAVVGRSDIADRLIIEITESQAIEDFDATRKIFARLKSMGLRTAIDDFGAGYTSFKHLRGLDVDILKIDGAFVQNIGQSADDSFFVRTLIDLARHLNIETVAEWVRDEGSAKKLADWGATYLQGDVIGPARLKAPLADERRPRRAA